MSVLVVVVGAVHRLHNRELSVEFWRSGHGVETNDCLNVWKWLQKTVTSTSIAKSVHSVCVCVCVCMCVAEELFSAGGRQRDGCAHVTAHSLHHRHLPTTSDYLPLSLFHSLSFSLSYLTFDPRGLQETLAPATEDSCAALDCINCINCYTAISRQWAREGDS